MQYSQPVNLGHLDTIQNTFSEKMSLSVIKKHIYIYIYIHRERERESNHGEKNYIFR